MVMQSISFGEMFWAMLLAMIVYGLLKLVAASVLYALSHAKADQNATGQAATERSLHVVEEK